MDFENTDAIGLAQLVQAGEVTPLEVVEAAIARANAVNPQINAIAEPLFDRARDAARSVDRSLPLAGVPVALKDLYISAKGVPVHSGSHLPAVIPAHDSVVMQRYSAAGLIPVCTSTTPEWGLSLMTESDRFGITRNPWNTAHTSGGSSGGAASLVAARVVPVAHASDAGGSIRVPAACTGLIGLKPSRGRVPLTPDQSEGLFGTVVQHVLTRSVRDCAVMLDLTSAPDPISPYAALAPSDSFAQAATHRRKGREIAVYRASPLGLPVSDEVLAALDHAVALCTEAGHRVHEIDLPMLDRAFITDFSTIIAAGFAGRMREKAETLGYSPLPKLARKARVLARLGNVISAGALAAALNRVQAKSRALLQQTLPYDAVLMPVIAHPPLECGAMTASGADLLIEQVLDMARLTRVLNLPPVLDKMVEKSMWFTHWPAIQNVSGQPAISLPVHLTQTGLPVGIQAVGRMGDEATLLSVAGQLEEIGQWHTLRAPV